MKSSERERIGIIGGGFGGLYTALKVEKLLSAEKRDTTTITLIDPKKNFVFLPLLYELAIESASIPEVAPMYNELLEKSKFMQPIFKTSLCRQKCSSSKANCYTFIHKN
jgi:NADH dehydrogenase